MLDRIISATVVRGARLATGCVLFLAVGTAAAQDGGCGDPFKNHFGPFDYRFATKQQRDVVERVHFNQDVAMLRKGASSMNIGSDIAYTLQVFPNHPRALMAMADLARRSKTSKPRGSDYDVQCWFERALLFRPDDPTVRIVLGIALLKDGKAREAVNQLGLAEKALPDNANVHYNLGLAHFELKEYDQSLAHAKRAYELGFPLPGLKNMLQKVNRWQ